MYEYACKVIRLVDRNTADLSISLGFNVCIHERFRLKGIDAPEARGKERELSKQAAAHLEYLIQDGTDGGGRLVVRTEKMKKGKYGRWVATLVLVHEDPMNNINLNEQMVKDGYAIKKEY